MAESSYHHPLYVRRLSYPFADVLCADISVEVRLAAIERAVDAGPPAGDRALRRRGAWPSTSGRERVTA